MVPNDASDRSSPTVNTGADTEPVTRSAEIFIFCPNDQPLQNYVDRSSFGDDNADRFCHMRSIYLWGTLRPDGLRGRVCYGGFVTRAIPSPGERSWISM